MAQQPTQQPQHPPVIDPDNVPEILCDGRFHVLAHGQLATMTFTHDRPAAAALFEQNATNYSAVVRARIVLSLANLVALRDLLNQIIKENPPADTKVH